MRTFTHTFVLLAAWLEFSPVKRGSVVTDTWQPTSGQAAAYKAPSGRSEGSQQQHDEESPGGSHGGLQEQEKGTRFDLTCKSVEVIFIFSVHL